jgi:phage/plasmid-like protein (TIGR03299 family)
MSHEIAINTKTGKAMCFTAGEPAWHHLGQNVSQAVTWAEAIKLAQLDWEVVKEPLFDQFQVRVPGYGVIRADNRQCLGIVGEQYAPIQNKYAFDFVDTMIAANGGTKFESAGGLYSGQTIWCLARVPKGDGEVVPGDKHEAYLLFTSSHDGSKAAICKIVTVRVVCHNTLTAALAGAGQAIKIRHSPSAEAKLEKAKLFLGNAVQQMEDLRLKMRQLAEREMTRESFALALDRLFPVPKGKEVDNSSARRDNLLAEVIQLYEQNDGNSGIASIKGSAYNLLNAVTQWTDHARGVRLTDKRTGMSEQAARADNAIFGTGAQLKENALDIILEATASNPVRQYSQTFVPVVTSATGPHDDLLNAVLDQPIRTN